MATTVRAIELMLPGSFGKETLSNDGMQNLALGISGAAVIALTNVDHTLTTDNQGEAMRFVQILTGALTANVNVIVPAESRVYVADNRTSGAFTVTFKTAAGGGVAVDQGVRTLIYCDGTTVYPVASGTGGGGGSGAPTDATYLVQAPHALLTGERAVTDTPTVIWDFATPGAAGASIPDGAVTYAKIQDITPTRLLGRFTAGSGDVQEITPGAGLTLDASGVLTATATGQPLDATLTALAGLATGADQLPYFTGTDTASQTPLTPLARTLLDDTTQGAMQGTLGLVPGTQVQAFDATLSALAGVTTGADTVPFFTGLDTASTTTLTPLARALLDDTTQAEMQATLGVTGGGGGSYTDEQAQDAVGAMLADTATIALLYDDATPALAAAVQDASLTEAKLLLADVTTLNVSTTQHGLVPKAPGSATQYLDGTGVWSTPAGGGGEWTRVPGTPGSTASTGLLAFWRLEEASGNRLDSVSNQALVPTGTPGSAAGKTGQAVSFGTGTGTYLSASDTATLSVGANQSFTVACWVRFNGTPSGSRGLVGKGNAASAYSGCEYLLGTSGTSLQWYIGSGSNSVNIAAGVPLAAATWYFVVGWYDAGADLQYVQVNNGSIAQIANAGGSHDSAGPVEVGRQPQWSGSAPFDGLIDNVMFWKRVLTPTERSDLWNSGNGLDYADLIPAPSFLHPTTSTDLVLAGGATPTASEPLESAGGVKLGTSAGTVDGVVRWTGTDFEGRLGGAWVSLTGPPLPLAVTQGGTGATDAAGARTALGLGTMAEQHANAVVITGGSGAFTGNLSAWGIGYITDAGFAVNDYSGSNKFGYWTNINTAGGTNRYAFNAQGTAPSYFGGDVTLALNVGVRTTPRTDTGLAVHYTKAGVHGLLLRPVDSDAVGNAAIMFMNAAFSNVGSIQTTATATSYNTSSDVRLKHNIQPLTNVLECIRALKPISHLWNADGSYGEGFLAHELMQQVPLAVTGEPDEVNPDGSVKPQQVDHSKLVPRLTAGLQAALAQIDALTARITTLEEALGL